MLTAILKGVLSVLALLIGGGIIVWVLYNEFIQRQPEFQRPDYVPFFGIGPIMVACGVSWGWQSLSFFQKRDV